MSAVGQTQDMKAVIPKKRGRRATGRDPLVQAHLPKSMIDHIDRWAARFDDMDRSTAVRCLLRLGLRSKARTVYDPKARKSHQAKVRRPQGSPPQPNRLGLMLIKNGTAS